MYTETDKNKMRDFIVRLISNPCFKNEPALAIESNIIQFLSQNATALRATFSSQNYFPNLNWKNAQDLFYNILTDEMDKQLLPKIKNIFQKNINFQFLNVILNRQIPAETFQNEMIKIISKFIKRFEIRNNLEYFIKIIDNNLIEKYLNEVFEKRSYIAREIQIVERLKLSPEFLSGLIKIIILISLLGYLRDDMSDASLLQKTSVKERNFGNIYAEKTFYEKIIRSITKTSSIFNEEIINKIIAFHLNFNDDKSIPATSRFSKIFFILGKNYNPKTKLDKGADTFEKSWFQSQRRNYKFFGFDIDMLNELYRISAENFW